MHGNKKFVETWDIVKIGKAEKDISGIENIQRGLMFEKDGVTFFETKSKSTTSSCGFFLHPSNGCFGASPDALGPNGILIEIKTRAKNSDGPLKNLDLCPHYFVQCQLQMACTDAHSCILVSYHPESKSGNFFLIHRDNILIDIFMEVCNSIYENSFIDGWHHNESKVFRTLGKKLSLRILDFDALKPLRIHVNKATKEVLKVKFVDEIEFQLVK